MAGRTRFGKYELVSRLAAGGMGETFRAELVATAGVTKQVVIKKMLPALVQDATYVEAFIQEARLSASLSHSNIAQVFDFGEIDGEYFLCLEYVDGRSLEKTLTRARELGWPRLPFQLSTFIIVELLKGLHYAHTRATPDGKPLNLVHRDITPDNVLLGFEGEVKLVDFGVAKSQMAGRPETEPGLVKGKFRYVSPEQATAKPLDARSDLFTVGLVFYQLLTGELPFAGQQHTVMQAIATGDYVMPRARAGDVPEPLATVVEKAMQTGRDQRYASAQEMLEPLSRWLYGQSPDFSGSVLRELLGQVFDAEMLADGRLFVSQASARAKLTTLTPGRDVPVPTQKVHPLEPVTQPERESVQRETKPSAPAVAQSPAKRAPPLALLGLAGALGVVAVGVVGLEAYQASRATDALAPPAPKPVPVPAQKPAEAAGGEQPAKQDVEPTAPRLPSQVEVSFDAEAAPVSVKLTKAHQVVVPKANCFTVGKKWELALSGPIRALSAAQGTKRSRYDYSYSNGSRLVRMFALFSGSKGAPQLWAMSERITGTDEGRVCAFGLTDRSLEQELRPAQARLNGTTLPLPQALINVEPDDRFLVRSFPPDKSWVVKVTDVTPPWPVLFVTERGGDRPIVLDQRETTLKGPKSAWLTVPVMEQTEYSRTVAIEPAPGERIKESAADLVEKARREYSRKDYASAARTLDVCINAYPTFAECHRMLGSTFAQLKYSDEARTQYLEFLKLAPNDPAAPEVKKIVADYDKHR